jgi:sugar phosphate isomerase/epimerase
VINQSGILNRRAFLRTTGGACLASSVSPVLGQSSRVISGAPVHFDLGVVVWIETQQSIDAAIRGIRALGLQTCQIGFEHLSKDVTAPLKEALTRHNVRATAFSEHGPGQRVFDFYAGPKTIGIVPRATRDSRIRNLQMAADVAAQCGIPAIHTHCGFIPEDPNSPAYAEAVSAMKAVAQYCKAHGCAFLCETGESTPLTLRRAIEDVGLDNIFVNLDLANLILYNKGNPVEALKVFGGLVHGIHAKDGLLPTNTRELGQEVALGEGLVDFPGVFKLLRQLNYQGPIHIEREIDAEEWAKEVLRSKTYLENIMRQA